MRLGKSNRLLAAAAVAPPVPSRLRAKREQDGMGGSVCLSPLQVPSWSTLLARHLRRQKRGRRRTQPESQKDPLLARSLVDILCKLLSRPFNLPKFAAVAGWRLSSHYCKSVAQRPTDSGKGAIDVELGQKSTSGWHPPLSFSRALQQGKRQPRSLALQFGA